jgi:glycosyltransferase involved in cell wall biosynthesis
MIPWDETSTRFGGGQRMLRMLQAAARVWPGLDVLFLAQDARANEPGCVASVEAWVRQQLPDLGRIRVLHAQGRRPFSSRLPARIGGLFWPRPPMNDFDAASLERLRDTLRDWAPQRILAHRLNSFRALRQAGLPRESKVWLDLDDIEHLAWRRLVAAPPHYRTKPVLHLLALPVLLEERRALARCEAVVVCSGDDVRKLAVHDRRRVTVEIPNAMTCPERSPAAPATPSEADARVLFVGLLDYPPNAVGMQWFIDRVWAKVLAAVPHARLTIVGRGIEHLSIPDGLSASVEGLGFVEALAPVYESATVAICPLLSGGGTRIKLIEAAAWGVPAVSTRIGAEGLALEDGRSILLADEPDRFAQAVIRVLSDRRTGQALARDAHQVFLQRYQSSAVLERIVRMLSIS